MRFPHDIKRLPDSFGLVAVGSNKAPYLDEWQHNPLTKAEIQREVMEGRCKAVGVLCGTKSGGILFMDRDGASCEGLIAELSNGQELPLTPGVTSGKPGHSQLIYSIPERYWGQIATKKIKTGTVGEDGKAEQLELRWNGGQSVIMGYHPDTGSYQDIEGQSLLDIAIAEAPEWVIRLMVREEREAQPRQQTRQDYQQNDRWTDTDWALSYLNALSPYRADDYEDWVSVGMALHSVDDSLLDAYIAFSHQSSKYKSGDAEKKWNSFKRDGVSIGSLAHMAKQDGWKSPFEPRQQQPRQSSGSDRQAQSSQNHHQSEPETKIDDWEKFTSGVSGLLAVKDRMEREFRRRQMAKAWGMPDGFLIQMTNMIEGRTRKFEPVDVQDFLERNYEGRQWIIANMIPQGSVIVLCAAGGSGKTTLVYNLIRHVAQGQKWSHFRVKQGKSLIIQADEPEVDTSEKLDIARFRELPRGTVSIETHWRFSQIDDLTEWIMREKPVLVVIDSLTAANAGSGIDQNDATFGDILYYLRDLANDLKITFIVLHHVNKLGESRGTSTIRDNTSELWYLLQGEPGKDSISKNQRILWIDKSRASIAGKYVLEQDALDYSWRHCGLLDDTSKGVPIGAQIMSFMEVRAGTKFTVSQIRSSFNLEYPRAELELEGLRRSGLIDSDWVVQQNDRFRLYFLPEVAPVQEVPINTASYGVEF